MIKLYLVRHGETDGNAQQWYQGSTDVPLNARGIVQAKYLGDFLKDEQFTAVYSSDLLRAEKTAELVAAPHRLPVTTYAELRKSTSVNGKDTRITRLLSSGPAK